MEQLKKEMIREINGGKRPEGLTKIHIPDEKVRGSESETTSSSRERHEKETAPPNRKIFTSSELKRMNRDIGSIRKKISDARKKNEYKVIEYLNLIEMEEILKLLRKNSEKKIYDSVKNSFNNFKNNTRMSSLTSFISENDGYEIIKVLIEKNNSLLEKTLNIFKQSKHHDLYKIINTKYNDESIYDIAMIRGSDQVRGILQNTIYELYSNERRTRNIFAEFDRTEVMIAPGAAGKSEYLQAQKKTRDWLNDDVGIKTNCCFSFKTLKSWK